MHLNRAPWPIAADCLSLRYSCSLRHWECLRAVYVLPSGWDLIPATGQIQGYLCLTGGGAGTVRRLTCDNCISKALWVSPCFTFPLWVEIFCQR